MTIDLNKFTHQFAAYAGIGASLALYDGLNAHNLGILGTALVCCYIFVVFEKLAGKK